MEEGKARRKRWLRVAIIVITIIAILLLLYCCGLRPREAADAEHPHARGATLTLGDVVVSGFSGIVGPGDNQDVSLAAANPNQVFINASGASVRIFDVRKPGFAWDARHWSAPRKSDLLARDVGQIFGIAIDTAAYPNIYLAATSVYGLNIVTPDSNNDGRDERARRGSARAGWMQGQFGAGGGPGTVWKIDGRTGVLSKFIDVKLGGAANHGPALGNIAHGSGQLFVSDFATGMIHRISPTGEALNYFDHGASGRPVENLSPVFHSDANRIPITSDRFDPLKPDSWGMTPPERRVWALSIEGGRLYYSVWKPSQIWSIELDRTGNFVGSPRWELDVPGGDKALPVSDIVFTSSGKMIVAQRAGITNAFDYSAFTAKGAASIYRFSLEDPNSEATKSRWILEPEEYAVGFAGEHRNTNGGIDLGYAFDKDGKIAFDRCEETLWTTGEDLRSYKKVDDHFEPDGPLLAQGIQAVPSGPVREFNTPPLVSYITDFDDRLSNAKVSGHLGSIRMYRVPCGGGVCLASGAFPRGSRPAIGGVLPPVGGAGGGGSGGGGGSCQGPDCVGGGCTGPDCFTCRGPDCFKCTKPSCTGCTGSDCCPGGICPPPPNPEACMKVDGHFVCDPAAGLTYKVTSVTPKYAMVIDMLKAYSQTPGVSVANGPHIPIVPPGVISLNGTSPGQTIALDLCGHSAAAAAIQKPHDCCRITLLVQTPKEACPRK